MAVTIHELGQADEARWDAFVAACPGTSFFHRAGWRRVVAESYGYESHFRYARRDGAIVGILPLVHVKTRLFGNALISTGFGVYGGVAARDDEATAALAEDAAALGRELGVNYVELRHQGPVGAIDWPAKTDVYATFRREILSDEAAALKAVPSKRRYDLKKSFKNGLSVEVDAPIDDFYRIYAESLRNLGTPVFPKRFFINLKREFGDAVEVAVVHGPDGAVAAATSLYFKDEVTPYYSSARPVARRLHAYDYMYWTLMRRAVARGAGVFDFGRSKFGTGSFNYKVFWGFKPEPLHYQYHLVRSKEIPNINPLNPKYRMFVETWKRLPLPVANLIGPPIARQLG